MAAKAGGSSDSDLSVLRSRCDLRSVVLIGSEADAVSDKGVHAVLRLLRRAGVRPKGAQPFVLRGGIEAFARRFGFCMRAEGEDSRRPLGPCPAELLPPRWAQGRGSPKVNARPPALYLGDLRCCTKFTSSREQLPLQALGVPAVVRLSLGQGLEDESQGVLPGLRVMTIPVRLPTSSSAPPAAPSEITVNVSLSQDWSSPVVPVAGAVPAGTSKDSAASSAADLEFELSAAARLLAAGAREACASAMRQTVPCLLVGPGSPLVAALCLSKVMPGPTRSVDELCALVKLRHPSAEFDALALRALQELLGPAKVEVRQSAGQNQPPLRPPLPPGRTAQAEMLCMQLRHRLRGGPQAETSLGTVRTALDKPHDERLRRLKGSNVRVQREVLAHPEAVALLRLAGFTQAEGDLVLPTGASIQALRDVVAGIVASHS
ncbi:unnamed protein product [Polarella glacialis]|uniref:Uncharacterized protein n=1 Tax=Polarella glacialis TaxID=89957 RepID=A0A813JSK8_POLGL|nr:unnamed protein product [Polarella glacialis]